MIEINLLPEELKAKPKSAKPGIGIEAKYFLYAIPLALCILICAHVYLGIINITQNSKLKILNEKWLSLEPQRKELEAFNKEYAVLSEDAQAIQKLTEQKLNWSEKLNKLSLNLPPGIWFNELFVSDKDLLLQGSVISLQKEEMSLLKKLIDNLKNDASFFKDFNNLELSSVQTKTIGGYDIADFVLVGTLKPK